MPRFFYTRSLFDLSCQYYNQTNLRDVWGSTASYLASKMPCDCFHQQMWAYSIDSTAVNFDGFQNYLLAEEYTADNTYMMKAEKRKISEV